MPRAWLSGVVGLAGALAALFAAASVQEPEAAVAAISQAPTLSAPAGGAVLADFNPTLQWTLPTGTVQYQIQVTPPDGPAINLIRNTETSYVIPAPPDWYGLLPDMTYTWKVRASDKATFAGESDPSWGPWSESRTFRTPKVTSSALTLTTPANGSTVSGFLPTLYWQTNDPDLWYFEVQVSKDPTYNTDPKTATAMVYTELRHGGATDTIYSYSIPSSFPLEPGTTYSWRVRPRVQGDGAPVAWTASSTFKTPSATALVLQVTSPADEATVTSASLTVTGQTKAGATVTVNEELAAVNASGNFSATVTLAEGINTIDVIASDVDGNIVTATLTVTYLP